MAAVVVLPLVYAASTIGYKADAENAAVRAFLQETGWANRAVSGCVGIYFTKQLPFNELVQMHRGSLSERARREAMDRARAACSGSSPVLANTQ